MISKNEMDKVKPIEIIAVDELPKVGKPGVLYVHANYDEHIYEEYIYHNNECILVDTFDFPLEEIEE